MRMPLLELQSVSSFYGNVQALRNVSLHVNEGEVVTLLGANGAGKSTTLRTISGLVQPASGTVVFNGQPIQRLGPEAIVRLGIAHVPEGRRVFPGLTVTENIMLGASNRGRLSKAVLQQDVEEMFAIFPDLKRLSKALGWSLSGGQQQMLAVARGLMARPKLLLLDEPSLGLAPIIVQQLFAVIRDIRNRGMTILLVEQNANMALSVADRGYVLETGQLLIEGSPQQLLNNDEVRSAYLGGARPAATT
jgi:branched-chain amino acid transport system ATP-binding protein